MLKWWFNTFWWEKDGEIYCRLGIRGFRPYVAWGSFWQRHFPQLTSPSDEKRWRRHNVEEYLTRSILPEAAHTGSLVFLVVIALALLKESVAAAVAITAMNFLVNFIPVLVIRYNRARIRARMSSRQGS